MEKVLSRLLIPESSSVVSDATSSPASVMPNDGTSKQQGRVGNEVNVDTSSVYFQGGRPVLAQGGQDFSSHQISSAAILAADKLQVRVMHNLCSIAAYLYHQPVMQPCSVKTKLIMPAVMINTGVFYGHVLLDGREDPDIKLF